MAENETAEQLSESVKKLSGALQKERGDHKAAKVELLAAQKHIIQLEALGPSPDAGKYTAHIADAIKSGVALSTVELQKQVETLHLQLAESAVVANDATAKLNARSVAEEVLSEAARQHVLPGAINDLLSLSALDLRVVDGIVQNEAGESVKQYLENKKTTSPWMWPTAIGSGARGSGEPGAPTGSNPFDKSSASWNLTAQSQMALAQPAKASRLRAEAAAMIKQ
jgi:hypothetical protein